MPTLHLAHPRRRLAAVAGLVVVAVLMTACGSESTPSGGNWPALNNDDRNTRFQEDSAITGRNVAQVKQEWFLRTEDTTSTPVVADGHVYIGDWSGNVYSVDVETGDVQWKVNIENPISSAVAVADGRVYVALSPYDTDKYPPRNGNRVVALDQSDGEQLWATELESTAHGVWASPIFYEGMVFVGVGDAIGQGENDPNVGGDMFGLDASSGEIAWSKELNGPKGGAGVFGSVAIDPDRDSVLFGTANTFEEADGHYGYSILSLDARSGRENWKYRVTDTPAYEADFDFGSAPNVFELKVGPGEDRTVVGLGSKDGNYHVVGANDGSPLRRISVNPDGGVLGIAGYRPTERGRAQTVFVPVYRNDYDLANPDICCGGLVAIDPEAGAVRWKFEARSQVIGSVAIAPGVVFFGDSKGNLWGVAPATGKQVFHEELTASIASGVTLAEGRLFVTTARGNPAFPPKTHPIPKRYVGLYSFAP